MNGKAFPGEKLRLAAAGLAASCLLCFVALPLLRGKVVIADDLGNYSLPLKLFYARCLEQGVDFTWCPQLHGGIYIHGEGQLGMFHPLSLLAYKTLPFLLAYNLEFWIRYPLLLAGTYFLLRRWEIPRDASLFGATAFAFSGFTVMHVVHLNGLDVICHLPWLLMFADIVLRTANPRAAAAAALAISLLTSSQLLLGHPQYVFFTELLLMSYALCLAWRRSSPPASCCGCRVARDHGRRHPTAANLGTLYPIRSCGTCC